MSRAADRVNAALGKHGYTQIRKVGEGSFGAAILAQHESDKSRSTKAVVKMIDISRASRKEKDDALKESQVLSSLRHPYIVRYRESFHEDGWLCIVMDYCEGGDLTDRIKKMKQAGKSFSEEHVLRWFTQAILALKYIHDLHILHRDLKSGNFFLSKSGNIKMGDFGIAKVLECTAAVAQTQIGTPYYLSPEICQGRDYAWGSDIWSMGCILYELCARQVPFDAPDLRSLIQRITKGPLPQMPSGYSESIAGLIRELLDRDATKRPPCSEILKRPAVQDVVRRLLDEVKGSEEMASEVVVPHSSVSGHACYACNEAVEFYSETHKEWLPATVTNADAEGRIMLNVKPNVWLSLEVQAARVRRLSAPIAVAAPVAVAVAPRASNPKPIASVAPAAVPAALPKASAAAAAAVVPKRSGSGRPAQRLAAVRSKSREALPAGAGHEARQVPTRAVQGLARAAGVPSARAAAGARSP